MVCLVTPPAVRMHATWPQPAFRSGVAISNYATEVQPIIKFLQEIGSRRVLSFYELHEHRQDNPHLVDQPVPAQKPAAINTLFQLGRVRFRFSRSQRFFIALARSSYQACDTDTTVLSGSSGGPLPPASAQACRAAGP
jgi:hypothetical protein